MDNPLYILILIESKVLNFPHVPLLTGYERDQWLIPLKA